MKYIIYYKPTLAIYNGEVICDSRGVNGLDVARREIDANSLAEAKERCSKHYGPPVKVCKLIDIESL